MRIVTKKKQVRSKGNLEVQVQELRDIFAGEGTLGTYGPSWLNHSPVLGFQTPITESLQVRGPWSKMADACMHSWPLQINHEPLYRSLLFMFHLHLPSCLIMLPSMWLAVSTSVLVLDCAVYDDSGAGELALPEFVEALVAAGGCNRSRGPCLRSGVMLSASSGLHTWMQLPLVQSPVAEQLTS